MKTILTFERCLLHGLHLYTVTVNIMIRSLSFSMFHDSCFASNRTMLEPILTSVLHSKKIVLASGSIRRKEILSGIGLKFEVIPSTFDESSIDLNKFDKKEEYALDIARHKVADVFETLKQKNALPDFVIGADTIVVQNNRVFGKPKDKEQAIEFLNTLSGKAHQVHTAVVIKSPTGTKDFVESTTVHMAPLSLDVIKAYVDTNEPMDKAGGYGIQGMGGTLIEKIEGDFYNVMGLPSHRFCINLQALLKESK